MPKREKTPDTGSDVRVLAIHYPYPPHANMERPNDRMDLLSWLADCIGKDPLVAICHKPSAPNTVLIEIARNFEDFGLVLGEHKWVDVFRAVHSTDVLRTTKVFFATLPDHRAIEKAGWKPIFLDDQAMRHWSRGRICNTPYPPPVYCELPSENQTGARLCRPLPRQYFPDSAPALPSPALVVGSSAWQAGTNIPPRQAKGKPPANARTKPGNSKDPANGVNNSTPRGRATVNKNLSSTTSSSASSNGSRTLVSSGPDNRSGSGWDTPGSRNASDDLDIDSVTDSFTAFDPWGSDGTAVPHGTNITSVLDTPPAAVNEEDNLWATPTTTNAVEEPVLCPSHGIVCKRGICADYDKVQRKPTTGGPSNIRNHPRPAKDERHKKNITGGGGWTSVGGRKAYY